MRRSRRAPRLLGEAAWPLGRRAPLRLRDEAAGRGLVLVAAPSVMLFPQVAARRRCWPRQIGQVHTVRGLGFGGVPPWEGYASDPAPFFRAGAGPLVDLGVYPLHAITGLLGPARRVIAMSARTRDGFEIVDGPLAGHAGAGGGRRRMGGDARAGRGRGSRRSRPTSPPTEHARPSSSSWARQGTIALSLLDVSAPIHVLDARGAWYDDRGRPVGRRRGPDHILGVEHLVECIRGGAPRLCPPITRST